MSVIFRSYEKIWFLIGLFFICLSFFSPEEYWFLVILIPLISGLMTFGIKHPVVVLSTNNKPRKTDHNQF